MAENRSHKDCLAICQRSGIETLKSKLVRDGFIRGMWVLPEYYCCPQFLTRPRPKPELPPFNPAPLIDTFLTTQTLNAGMQFTEDSVGNVPYVLSATGKFRTGQGLYLVGVQVDSFVGDFTTGDAFYMIGVEVQSAVYEYGEGEDTGYGQGYYGGGPYGGNLFGYGALGYGEGSYGDPPSPGEPDFIIAFHMVAGPVATTATGIFKPTTGYGGNGYGDGPYGGSYSIQWPLLGVAASSATGTFSTNPSGLGYGANSYGQNSYGAS